MASENGKFKVGDRVRRVRESDSPDLFGELGKEYTVLAAHAMGICVVPGKPGADPYAFELVPAWQPKVGDRVVVTDNTTPSGSPITKYTVGEQYEVTGLCKDTNFKDGVYLLNHHQYLRRDQYEQAPVPATLTIEAGKFYKTRNGRKVGPMTWSDGRWYVRAKAGTWNGDGSASRHHKQTATEIGDLVALWEEPASNDNAAVAKPKFKVGDRVTQPGWRKTDESTVVSVSDHDIVIVDSRNNRGSYPHSAPFVLITTPTTPAIVALIENGTPRPSTAPKVHTSQEAATTEAERLAIEHPGQQFGVFVLADSKIADIVMTQTAVLRAA